MLLATLALGLVLAAVVGAVVGWRVEQAWRAAEQLNLVQPVFEPRGLKFAYSRDPDSGGLRGWYLGLEPWPTPEGHQRIVAVGDSVTHGMGVELEQAWPAVLEARLGDVEVLNFGFLGYDIEQVATLVEAEVTGWDPDLVVYGNFANDTAPTFMVFAAWADHSIFVGSWVPERARLVPEVLSRPLLEHSAFFRAAQGTRMARLLEDRYQPPVPEGWYGDNLERLAQWSRDTDTPVLVLTIPEHILADRQHCRATLDPNACKVAEEDHAEVLAAAKASGLPWVDGQAAYAATGREDFMGDHGWDPAHPNAAGHVALVDGLEASVRRLLGRSPAAGEAPDPAPR